MNKKVALGQFYTPTLISYSMMTLALELLKFPPRNVIELAAGNGDLIKPLKEAVPHCNVTAVDIDSDNARNLSESMNVRVYNKDSMEPLNFLENTAYDLALGNPPFLSKVYVTNFIKKIVKENLNLDFEVDLKIRAELVFISQYMSLLDNNGILAVILPDSLLCGKNFSFFRKALMEMWEIEKIVEITGTPFALTEAKTHIIYIRKCKPHSDVIEVLSIDQSGKCCKESIMIPKSSLIDRMDYSFFKSYQLKNSFVRKLGDHATIHRGRKTHKALSDLGEDYLHTTHVNKYASKGQKEDSELYLCRVGARVVGKSFLYSGKEIEFSDCLYLIKFEDRKVMHDFYNYINSEQGFHHLKCRARGVCSKYLTVGDLKDFTF